MKNQSLCEDINIFMDLIYEKRNLKGLLNRIVHKIRLKEFKKSMSKYCISNFYLLWNFAEFIKLAEEVFFFKISSDGSNGLYSSRNFRNEQNGFKITQNDKVITVKLFGDTEKVAVDIFYKDLIDKDKKNVMHSLVFRHGDLDNEKYNIYDKMLLRNISKEIYKEMLNLFYRYYGKVD